MNNLSVREKPKRDTVIDESLDLISEGIEALEGTNLERLAGRKAVDTAAKLNAQLNKLNQIVEPLKSHIKETALSKSNQDTVEEKGFAYKAVVSRITKQVLDNEAIKDFLGSKLSRFRISRHEVQIKFQVQE